MTWLWTTSGRILGTYDYGHLKLAMDITQATLINGFIGSAQQLADASGGGVDCHAKWVE